MQLRQNGALLRGQRLLPPRASHDGAGQIDERVAEPERRRPLLRGSGVDPLQDGRKPQHQLLRQERLHHVVVRAEPETEQPVLVFAPRGQEQDGQIRELPDRGQQRKAVSVGQHHIQHRDVRPERPDERQRRGAVPGGVDAVEPFLAQKPFDHRGDLRLIVDDEDFPVLHVLVHRPSPTSDATGDYT
ncbi:MAG: hypothetical protein A9Z00_14390 [Thermobacillus sp. ZCTH02-B1]|nr:MAG: hypothetical protein A9Z00_14390 [Thermobacillus sp. ZCTH02-B1]